MKLFISVVFLLSYNFCFSQCNTWLNTPSQPSSVKIGQLNVPGNKITVEATINRTAPYSGGLVYAGDVVSKHSGPIDVNYLLRPNDAEITTTNGYFRTPDICEIELNKTYHIAMVYDGSILKFYRNGFLMSQVAATGDLYQNTWQTTIGYYDLEFLNENFVGYINEVRIWNTVRTQAQIRSYMNTSLPNPTTQAGLLAYYTFDNLLNKQGNSTWNGTLEGSASINQSNPNCAFIADSCEVPVTPGIIINDYTPVISFDPCLNKIIVEDAGKYNPGDTVLIIQMKGAIIDSSNTSSFGNITNYKNAGNYEFNYVKQKNGNVIELKNSLTRQYDVPFGKVQLVRVPYYKSYTVNNPLTCLPWDGRKGGVLAFNVKDTLVLNNIIDISGNGFIGGQIINPMNNSFYCHENNYYYPNDPIRAAPKGEGIASLLNDKIFGKGALANGGGGGLEHNSGGGGGSNSSIGGKGGKEWISCNPIDNGGIGGKALSYSNTLNKIFLGGGGGAGHCDNLPGFDPNGGDGGGIMIIQTNFLKANSNKIISDGASAAECVRDNQEYKCHEGMGGGGGGGSVILKVNTYLDNATVSVNGGKGADMNGEIQGKLGPGGGGSGGVVWVSAATLPLNLNVQNKGGINGINIDFDNDPYGATPGQDGINVFNLKIPVDTVLFKKNIDSVRITDSVYNCNSYAFKGLAYLQVPPVSKWQWSFGDGTTAATQNNNHTYASEGGFTVKLVVTDASGCTDSISKVVKTSIVQITKSKDTAICGSSPFQLSAEGGIKYAWTPAATLNKANINKPVATPVNTTFYHVTVTNAAGCAKSDSVKITVNSFPVISKSNDTTICNNSFAQLFASGGTSYSWSPASSLNKTNVSNPVASPTSTTNYYVTVKNSAGCVKTDSVKITTKASPLTTITNDTAICKNHSVQLFATGGTSYVWTPASTLDNPNVSNPVATPASTTIYKVAVKNSLGCSSADSVKVSSKSLPSITTSQDVAVCNNTSVQLSANGGASYSWSPKSTLNDPNINNPVATPSSTTIYYVTATNSAGCSNIDSVKVSTSPPPEISKSNNQSICTLTSAQLFVSGGTTYKWTPASTLNNATINNPIATPSSTTTYIVEVSNSPGCSQKDSIKISVYPKPFITTSNDTIICNNSGIRIFANGGVSYQWMPSSTLSNPNISNPVATPIATTVYQVIIKDANTCSYTDSVKLTIKPPPVFTVSANQSVCTKDSKQLSASGGNSYSWQPAASLNNPSIPNPIAKLVATTTFTVKIKESTCNDSAILNTILTVLPLPQVNATKSNDINCSAISSQLSVSGAATYTWTPAGDLNNNTLQNPVATPKANTIFTVKGTDNNGCSNTDTVSVKVSLNSDLFYSMPNSFTPNGDHLNDCYGLKYWGTVGQLNFSIYNRFGERVFYTSDASLCWDGKYKGKPQNPDVFVYLIHAITACGIIDKKGSFVLIR